MLNCTWTSFGITEASNECFTFSSCDSIDENDIEYVSSQSECYQDSNANFSEFCLNLGKWIYDHF